MDSKDKRETSSLPASEVVTLLRDRGTLAAFVISRNVFCATAWRRETLQLGAVASLDTENFLNGHIGSFNDFILQRR